MIYAIVKQASDVDEFERLLDATEYTYSKKLARIFFVETDLDDFTLKTCPLLEACQTVGTIRIEPHATTFVSTEENIRVYDPSETVGVSNWARSRIIRRRNPFVAETTAPVNSFDLPYYSTRTGVGVDVYTMDAGYDNTHDEFKGRSYSALNTVSNGANSHGVWTASCVIGNTLGMAPNASLFILHDALLTQGTSEATEEYWADKLDVIYQHYLSRAATNNPAVVYMSFGTMNEPDRAPSPVLTASLLDMCSAGMSLIASAGNNNTNLDVDYVAPIDAIEETIGVGATNYRDGPMWRTQGGGFLGGGTSHGDAVDIYAPGSAVLVPKGGTGNEYFYINGTSFSGPYVAGVLACMLEGYQRPTTLAQNKAIKKKLLANATKGALRFGTSYYGDASVTTIHDRLVYLDPKISYEYIEGLTRR